MVRKKIKMKLESRDGNEYQNHNGPRCILNARNANIGKRCVWKCLIPGSTAAALSHVCSSEGNVALSLGIYFGLGL